MIRELLLTATLSIAFTAPMTGAETVTSPDGDIRLSFDLENGRPFYTVDFKGRQVIAPSCLGLELYSENGRNTFSSQGEKAAANALLLNSGFDIVKTLRDSVSETWTPVWGEEAEILNRYNGMTVELRQPEFDRVMNIEFRVFDDGIAFRYDFPAQPHLNYFVIKEEKSQFAMTDDHWAYWIPGDYDTQ